MPTVIEFVYTHSILPNVSINTTTKIRDSFVHHGRTAITPSNYFMTRILFSNFRIFSSILKLPKSACNSQKIYQGVIHMCIIPAF